MEFRGEGAEDPCHHNAIQPSPIDGQTSDIGEDIVVQGVSMKCEKDEITPPLVVGRRGFQNDCDHRSYVLDVGSLRVQVHGKGGVGGGAGVDKVIIIVVLGDRDPLGSSELLFQVISDGLLLLLSSEGGGSLTCTGLIQDLACNSHGGDESLLLSLHDSRSGLSRGRDVVPLPLSGGDDLLLIDRERLEMLFA
jgi:hypothetical protein